MSQVIMIYDAKCKHCLHFKYIRMTKKDGSPSKRMAAFCTNINSLRYNDSLTLKTLACDKLEL